MSLAYLIRAGGRPPAMPKSLNRTLGSVLINRNARASIRDAVGVQRLADRLLAAGLADVVGLLG